MHWDPPPSSERNGVITEYTIEVENRNTGEILENSTLPIPSRSKVVENLHPHTSYVYRIAAHTVVGRGPFTPDYHIMTSEDGEYKTS